MEAASASCWRATTRSSRRDRHDRLQGRDLECERHLPDRHRRVLLVSRVLRVAETSLVRMNNREAFPARPGSPRAQGPRRTLGVPEKFLNTILLLVLICQLVSATMVGVLAGRLFGAAGLFIATVGEVLVIFVVFERSEELRRATPRLRRAYRRPSCAGY